MPLSNSWFYKLRTRRRRSAARGGDAADAAGLTGEPGSHRAMKTIGPVQEVVPCLCSPPNRASYYVPTGDRRVLPLLSPGKGNPKLRDTHFPRSPHPSDIVFDVVAVGGDGRFDCLKAMPPELKLRPILTRPAAAKKNMNGDGDYGSESGTSAAASPMRRRRRLDVKGRADAEVQAVTSGRHARRRWLYESLVVVKESADPEEDFLESMEEMIAAAELRSPRGLEELLACYLALNAAEHHGAIVGAFRRAWLVDHTADAAVKPSRL